MLPFDPRVVGIAVSAPPDHCSRSADAEDLCQAEVGSPYMLFGIHAGFECSQQRSALLQHMSRNCRHCSSLNKAVLGRINAEYCLKPFGLQPVLVYEIKQEATFQQRIVHAIHVLRHKHIVRRSDRTMAFAGRSRLRCWQWNAYSRNEGRACAVQAK